MVRHGLTKEALKDLLLLLNVLLPGSVPVTEYKFFKAFETGNFQVKASLFCKPGFLPEG